MTPLTNVIVSGGGTGGHIHPALAIADEIVRRNPEANVRFVGALGRMEMDKVPAAGYDIDGLWITGVERKLTSTRNLVFPFMLLSSLWKARRLLKRHRPQVVVGVGGFASGPLLDQAVRLGVPTLIQEQNSFPGVTNRLLAHRVVGFAGCPAGTLVSRQDCPHWNPRAHVRFDRRPDTGTTDAAVHWGLSTASPSCLSWAAVWRAVHERSRSDHPEQMATAIGTRIPTARQCAPVTKRPARRAPSPSLRRRGKPGFIDRMDLAYQSATVIASRAGAMSTELALVGKLILVPSPHVAEDHQTHNAKSLTELGGGIPFPDNEVREQLGADTALRRRREANLNGSCHETAARPDAASAVVDELNNSSTEPMPNIANKHVFFLGIGGIGECIGAAPMPWAMSPEVRPDPSPC